ncbi:MAG: hypothetical protein HOA49_02750 [Flavobacteriales bacterium]|jgi:hypothetical protein|nr:hypothetical protein [Flavobacteriales bacterium]MBT4738176.1 hypothetical protein [Flavobacteriales bacterium]MBT5353822.1 hypothetical protein [Flavobacteriales bacterium]MBT5698394.1 hypothetical protein [Flavobacteriales bacterium]MBT6815307.1 hypothetical protein [Flavobacteriales bacterium]
MKKILFISLLVFIISSCKKEDDSLFNISLLSTSPISLQEFQENIIVEIEFEHSEGFMGFYDPDYLSLEVKDSRLTNADYYHLIPLNPPDNELEIKGIIQLEIDAPFILGSGNLETLFFTMRIQDREGEWSNDISTPLISVSR